jgi:hypothetical protein
MEDSVYPIIVFNLFENCYQLLQMRSVWTSDMPPATNTKVYSSHVLKVDRIIFSTPHAAEMVMLLKMVNVSAISH